MNKKIKEAKKHYDDIPVPEQLSGAVERAVTEAGRCRYRTPGVLSKIGAAVAAVVFTFVLLLNTNPVFASAMTDIPVLGQICRIVTFTEYQREEDFDYISERIHNISDTGNSELEARVNMEIRKLIDYELETARTRAKEYYDAFIATGGKREDYTPMSIYVDYDIKCMTDETVSFVIYKVETLASAYGQVFCYNIDLETGRYLTLKDVFGPDYHNIVWNAVKPQLVTNDDMSLYYFEEIDVEPLITEDRMFYLTDNGNTAVIKFDKYEIAAGAAGMPEFEVPVR